MRPALARAPLAPLLARHRIAASRVGSAFELLNGTVSAAAIAAVVVGLRRARPELPGVLAAAMLVNVLVPHVPAAVRARGYAPGLASAVLLVLPVTASYLQLARAGGVLTDEELRDCLVIGAGLVVVGVPVGLVLADRGIRRMSVINFATAS